MIPKLPIDFNSNSAFEKLKFIEEHYEELMLAYKDIMEHLKIPVLGGGESLFDVVTFTNPKPIYVTLRFVDSLPPSLKTSCYFGSPKFDRYDDIDNDTVSTSYIQNLVGASYFDEIVPYDDSYKYFLRIYRNGVEIDYDENSSLRYSDNDSDWDGLELRLFRLNRYEHDAQGEDLGDFVSAVERLFTPTEIELKPTSSEILRGLSIQDENYLINETDTPYTYAIDCCKYNGQYLRLNGGTYSNIGTVNSSSKYGGFLGVNSSCSSTSAEANHFYVNVLIDTNGDSYFSLSTYKAEEDNTPFTFTRLVPKV